MKRETELLVVALLLIALLWLMYELGASEASGM